MVRRTSQLTTRATASRASAATARLFMASRSRSEPVATMPQNELVAWVPYSPLAGTAYAVAAPSSSVQVSGLVHWSLVLGPVGPL